MLIYVQLGKIHMTDTPKPEQPTTEVPRAVAVINELFQGIDQQYDGVDFSRGMDGKLRMNVVPLLAHVAGHLSVEERQAVVRDLCTYEAHRLLSGEGTTLGNPVRALAELTAPTPQPVDPTEVGIDPSLGWQGARAPVAALLRDGIGDYHESLIDKGGTVYTDRLIGWQAAIDGMMDELRDGIAVVSDPLSA
jgi:hypothetical protein